MTFFHYTRKDKDLIDDIFYFVFPISEGYDSCEDSSDSDYDSDED